MPPRRKATLPPAPLPPAGEGSGTPLPQAGEGGRRPGEGGLLYPYQTRWLSDTSRFKIGMFARQTGKTFTATLEIVLDCLEAEAAGKRARWVILSRGERQAKEAMDEGIKRHLMAVKAAFQALEYPFDPQTKALEVALPGGSRITALPANPDTARGFSASVLLDEFAFHADSRKIWQALFPVISAGHKLRVVSTPNGKGNKFYELMTAKDLDTVWSRHVCDIHRAVAEGLPRDVAELKAGIGDADAWAQEYELQWLDEASAWLPYELIDACESDECALGPLSAPEASGGRQPAVSGSVPVPKKQGADAPRSPGPCFVGVDIAARNDLFVIWVAEAVGDVLWTREIIARQRISFAEQDALLAEVFARYRVVRCCMDQTGMGEKPVEDAKRRHGASRVEGVLFTGPAKLELATVGKEAFEDRKIRIPKGHAAVRADLHKLQKITTATGAPRFVADSDASGHADRAWACFMALYAAKASPSVIAYTPVPLRARPAESRDPDRSASPFSRHGWRRGAL